MTVPTLTGEIMSETFELDGSMLIRCCRLQQQELVAMVEMGVLEPRGEQPSAWRFSGTDVRRAQIVQRLTRDLGVNLEGAALIIDLLEERAALRTQIRWLNRLCDERDEI